MTRTRYARAAAVLLAVPLALAGCSLPQPFGPGAPDLAGTDVITLTRPSLSVAGAFGTATTTIDGRQITSRFTLPDETEIYSVTEEITAEERTQIENAAEEYLQWERTVPEEARPECTDTPSLGVTVTGSITHESSVIDCMEDGPLDELLRTARDAQSDLTGQLAVPTSDWTIEVLPQGADGPDDPVPLEQYRISDARHGSGMEIEAQDAPEGWGTSLEEHSTHGGDLGWDSTGTVLVDLNSFLLGQDQLGCEDPEGEIRVTREGDPSTTWTAPLCSDQQSEALLETLREL